MKSHTKLFAFWLPLMVLLTIVGWTLFGALPGAVMTGDETAWLLELPIVTCYARAAAGAAVLTMHITGMNLENSYRCELTKLAAGGNPYARQVLIDEMLAWFFVMGAWCVFFFPHF